VVGDVVFEVFVMLAVKGFGVVILAPLFLHIEVIDDRVWFLIPAVIDNIFVGITVGCTLWNTIAQVVALSPVMCSWVVLHFIRINILIFFNN
jgi:hypothetical protein